MDEKVEVIIYKSKGKCDIESYVWDEEKQVKTNKVLGWNSFYNIEESEIEIYIGYILSSKEIINKKEVFYNNQDFGKLKGETLKVYEFYPAQLERIFYKMINEMFDYRPNLKVEHDNHTIQPINVFFKEKSSKEFKTFWRIFCKTYEKECDIDESYDIDDVADEIAKILLSEYIDGEIIEYQKEGRHPEFATGYESYVKVFVKE